MSLRKKADKRNWDVIRNQDYRDTLRGRDVYEEQQLERGEIAPMQSMKGRDILNAIICVFVALVLWFVVAMIQWAVGPKVVHEYSLNPADTWVYMNDVYVNKDNTSDRVTPEEYAEILTTYETDKDTIEPVEDPGTRPVYKAAKDMYSFSTKDYRYHLLEEYAYLDLPDTLSSNELAEFSATWEERSEAILAEYDVKKAEYDEYLRRTVDPAETYSFVTGWYYNLRTDESMSVEEYNKLYSKYERKLATGKYSDDELTIPAMPLDMSKFYKASAYDDDKKPVAYRNKLDATTISAEQYDQLVVEYSAAMQQYEQEYNTHRQIHHPDNISGKVSVNFGFNLLRLVICLGVGGLLFLILRPIFVRNLKAENLTSDTSEINQYHEDQHIALPEEVQKMYDWFPDVGAHSAVSVSSMISHMALLNKGLKDVVLAKRADKDMKDEDGEILYYKGEILCDKNGEQITKKVPMIDDKFADALFEASGAPPSVRKKYDATKIPYNPDGKNRDKLGKYKTVADLINDDWEFPIYEPQRPGGAYVVDTAPVNTMVLAITRAGKGKLARLV